MIATGRTNDWFEDDPGVDPGSEAEVGHRKSDVHFGLNNLIEAITVFRHRF